MARKTELAHPTRRSFLVVSAATAACAGLANVGLASCGGPCMPAPTDSGLTTADLAVGDVVCPQGANYFVARDENGYFAFSSACTHAGCTIPCPHNTSGTSTCSCHGSRFDGEGRVLAGPATRD